jgi:hypothetical protein
MKIEEMVLIAPFSFNFYCCINQFKISIFRAYFLNLYSCYCYFKINSFSKNTFITLCILFYQFYHQLCFSEYNFKKGTILADLSLLNRILQIADVKEASLAAGLRYWKNFRNDYKDPITGIDWGIES